MTLELEGSANAGAQARRALAGLRDDLDPPLMETLQLLATELVTNSVKHARANNVVLQVLVRRHLVWAEVADPGPGFGLEATRQAGSDHTGWGLYLVEQLADRWGVTHERGATRVWFELSRAA